MPTKSKKLSQPLWNFFKVELRNQDAGGVTPATISSAQDTFRQTPDDVLGSWFGVAKFSTTERTHYRGELLRLAKAYGRDAELSTILSEVPKTNPTPNKPYTVIGLYADNQQPWMIYVSAKDPTAAAIKGIKNVAKNNESDTDDLFVVEVVAGKVEGLLGNDACLNLKRLQNK